MRSLLLACVGAVGPAAALRAQCDLEWQTMLPLGGANSNVLALENAPSGELFAAGDFTAIGATLANRIARWDGSAWHALGGGVDGTVASIAVLPNGDVVCGGAFTFAGGAPAQNVARWDGASWWPLGAGLDGRVQALHVLPGGQLLAGGEFSASGGQPAVRIASWNGTNWSQFGTAIGNGIVRAITHLPGGEVVIGGMMDVGQHQGAVRWDGAAWQGFGAGLTGIVNALAVDAGGGLVLAGGLSLGGLPHAVVRWDGTGLTALPDPEPLGILAVHVGPAGRLYVAGGAASGSADANVARFDGVAWTTLLRTRYRSYALAEHGGGVVVGSGKIGNQIYDEPTIRRFDGAAWRGVGGDSIPKVSFVGSDGRGGAYVGGSFSQIGGVPASQVGHWDGSDWSVLGDGLEGLALSFAASGDGGLVVGGFFDNEVGVLESSVHRWNGATWTRLGTIVGLPSRVAMHGTRVAVVVSASVRVFEAGVWTELPGVPGASPQDVAFLTTGEVVAAYVGFNVPCVRIWTGAQWHVLGNVSRNSPRLGVAADGRLFLLSGTPASIVEQWNGTSWQQLGQPFDDHVLSLTTLLDGDVVVGGRFTQVGGVAAAGIARWNGSAWSEVDGGLALPPYVGRGASSVASSPDGALFCAGEFSRAGNAVHARVARAMPTCPAAATSFGSGCAGGGRPLQLVARSLPYVGTSLQLRSVGQAPMSLTAHLLGSAVALPQPLPFAAPGCALLVQQAATTLFPPAVGHVDIAIDVPDTAALVGLSLRSQVVTLEFGPAPTPLRTASSNALDLTIGGF